MSASEPTPPSPACEDSTPPASSAAEPYAAARRRPAGRGALDRLLADPTRRDRITHVEVVPRRPGVRAAWPAWVPRLLIDRLSLADIKAPWKHQARAAELAHDGESVIIATGTASGKSLAYLLPALTAVLGEDPGARAVETPPVRDPQEAPSSREGQAATLRDPRETPHPQDPQDAVPRQTPRPQDAQDAVPRQTPRPQDPQDAVPQQTPRPQDAQDAVPRQTPRPQDPQDAVPQQTPRPQDAVPQQTPRPQDAQDAVPRQTPRPQDAHDAAAQRKPHPKDAVPQQTPRPQDAQDAVPRQAAWEASGDAREGPRVRDGVPVQEARGRRARVPYATQLSWSVESTGDGCVLYLAPTKALAADQLRSLRSLRLARLRAATYDGDTPADERTWVRQHANYVLTNPDMLHRSILPSHARWMTFLRRLRYVVVDEAHGYRGVFGSHVAQVLRRLRRICARYGAYPTFILASATTAEPSATASRLTGLDVTAVADDASPRGATTFALWEPPLTDLRGEHGAPIRRTATAEAADVLADLVVDDVQTLTFVRSRRGAEAVALNAKRALSEATPELAGQVAAYRAGYLPEERRELERALRARELVGLATTNALELGVDVSGLDAVLVCGWPGTRASLWQQSGRAGRSGQDALAVLVARDDPLDTYLVHHPEAIFGNPVEATVLDPDNPYVLEPHLCAAAAELPLTEDDLALFGRASRDIVPDLVRRGMLRRRPKGWYWTRHDRATDLADIRGAGGSPIQVVESATGRLLGTVDEPSAYTTVHEGAVYVHQGESYIVQTLDLDDSVALVEAADPDYSTTARDVTDIAVVETLRTTSWGPATLYYGTVEVTRQVVAYQMRRLQTGELLGEKPLDLPTRSLRTRAVWWTLADEQAERALAKPDDHHLAGAAHAAEHASIGLLPLFATCDRWDIGGVSTARHPDTELLTVFVYDGHEGGAGFAERGYRDAAEWLRATRAAIGACECESGCPSCIQSPKCGNGNEPLDKRGALDLLAELLRGAPAPSKVTNR